jgi:multidrug efflux pump subunit AcrA (membrane-fusion protein)
MGAFLIVIAIVVGAATWEITTEIGGEYFAMYIVEPVDPGASRRVSNTLNDGQPSPAKIFEGKVSNVLLAAYAPAAGSGMAAPAKVASVAREAPKTAAVKTTTVKPSATKSGRDDGGGAAVVPRKTSLAPTGSGMVDKKDAGNELTALLSLIGDTPHRMLDGTVFLPIATQRLFGLRTVLGERVSVPVTYELPGRIVVDPASNTLVQVSNNGFVEAVDNRFPFIGQAVKRGDLLALMQPINDHLEQAHTLERIQELTNHIDMARKRMARLEEVIYIRYRDSKIEALRVEIIGLQRQLDVLRGAIEMRYELRAKTDGIVSRVEAQVGQYVQQGQTIFEIVDPTRLWAEATAFESHQARHVQDASAFTADGRKLKLRFIGGGLKLRNQATPLRFEIVDPVTDLTVDNPVSVIVRSQNGEVAGVKVPRSALVRGTDGRQFVWERRSAERFIGHHVSSRSIDAGHVLVTEGLPASVRVVVEGAAALDQIR